MLLLGLLLVAATGAFTGLLIADNFGGGPEYTVTVLGNSIATMNSMAIFLSGAALALLFCLGLALARGAGRLAARRRSKLRSARHEARDARAERDDMLASRGSADARGDDPVMREDPTAAESGRGTRHRRGRHMFGH